MTDSVVTATPPTIQDNPYAREVRFGVVMYGGVSLAIYINGVTNELYEMACATPKAGETPGRGRTREVYRKASWLLRDNDLRKRYLDYVADQALLPEMRVGVLDPFADAAVLASLERTRFVVDTIAGTSAGGINGLVLAKALANGQSFAPLKTLWVQEGDIDKLLNDGASYDGLDFVRSNAPPQSLLNSDRMYLKLLSAFEGMEKVIDPIGTSESRLVDEIDLFITTTDIRGAIVPLRLFDKVVYEQRYKQVYHFQYAAANGDEKRNDLKDEDAPFLAFAARCTSSFPFAFEPMCIADAQRLYEARWPEKPIDFNKWKSFFTGLSSADMVKDRWHMRAFGDGGYLDNKPFSYVVDALSWRLGELPMERKLVYVEPAPSDPELEKQSYDTKPDAIENALAALVKIPLDETIREDLEAVLVRNRRIERVERIVRQAEHYIATRKEDPFERIDVIDGAVPKWRERDMSDMVNYYGLSFLGYRRLRVMTATDDIADRLAVWWDIDRRSDRLYALRALARAWREGTYYEDRPKDQPKDQSKDQSKGKPPRQIESVNAFLDDFDVKYRLRRAGFLLRKVHQLLGLMRKLKKQAVNPVPFEIEDDLAGHWKLRLGRPIAYSDDIFKALIYLAREIGRAVGELRAAGWMAEPDETDGEKRQKERRSTLAPLLDQVLRILLGEESALKQLNAQTGGAPVRLPTDLPPPSPLRTLQENVFLRAESLFQQAVGARKTEIQEALEVDIELLKSKYKEVLGRAPSSSGLSPRDLLGDPKLVPATTGPGKPKVAIKVGDVPLTAETDVLNTKDGRALREFLAEYYVRFDEYDQISFPLYYDTGTGEPATVEVVRISPEDARSLVDERNDRGKSDQQRRKLAGTAVFHFGAFLDARWRRNDIMWGRLDGCERVLDTLFPSKEDREVKEALLQEAQRTIIREEMQMEGYAKLLDNFAAALSARPDATLGKAFDNLWKELPLASTGQRRVQTAQALKAVLGDASMVDYVRQYYEVDRKLEPKSTLKTASRALTITGLILQQAEIRHQAPWSRTVWLTRAGRALHALLAVSTPDSIGRTVFRHWLILLYIFEVLIVVGATGLGAPATRTFGFTLFGITLAVHLASLMTGDLIGRKRTWIIAIATVFILATAGLIVVGASTVYNDGPRHVICSAGQGNDSGIFGLICKEAR